MQLVIDRECIDQLIQVLGQLPKEELLMYAAINTCCFTEIGNAMTEDGYIDISVTDIQKFENNYGEKFEAVSMKVKKSMEDAFESRRYRN